MPFREKKTKKKQTGHWFPLENKRKELKKTCREEINGTKDLDRRTILPLYFLLALKM